MHYYAIVPLEPLKDQEDFERRVKQAGPNVYADYAPKIYFVQSSSSPRAISDTVGFTSSGKKITGFVTQVPQDAYSGYASRYLWDFLPIEQ